MVLSKHKLNLLPDSPGVYLMKNEDDQILYIGKAKCLKERVKQYFSKSGDDREMIPILISQVISIETIVTLSEKEALLLENTLIKKHKPKYNVLLKDDKSFISLHVNTDHAWPMVKLLRTHEKPKKSKGLFFGPYTSAYAARQTLETLNKIFPLRECSDRELKTRKRPCLLYSIKRCSAPCVRKCPASDYEEHVHNAIAFLKGQDKEVLKELKEKMSIASSNLEFERAGALLKKIQQIEEVTKYSQSVVDLKRKDSDALALFRAKDKVILVKLIFREGRLSGAENFSFKKVVPNDEEIFESFLLQHYERAPKEILLPLELSSKKIIESVLKTKLIMPQKGEKANLIEVAKKNAHVQFLQEEEEESLLLDLQESLKLNRLPYKIECFDTSNIAGSDLVASLVVYINGKREKKGMRHFIIQSVNKSDDYGAMREALTRHYKKAKDADLLPDLLMVDGGKGQLNIAVEVFKNLDIVSTDIISIAKEKGRHDKGLTKERIFIPTQTDPISLSPHSSLLRFLQQIRDESHRAVITFHKTRRKKRTLTSQLDSISGIGPKKKRILLKSLGSLQKIQEASIEKLQDVEGISKKDAEAIYQFFQNKG